MHDHRTRPDVRGLLDYLSTLDAPPIERLDPAVARESLLTSVSLADLPAVDVAVVENLTIPGPGGPIAARLFDSRATRGAGPAVLWLHGGGFVTGGIESHHSLCSEVARQLDLPVVLVDYRLAPEAPFPAAPDDAEAAARWIAANPTALGGEVTGLVLAGDSAGGNLAIVTAMALRDAPAPVPALAQLTVYPAPDGSKPYPSVDEFADGYLLTKAGHEWYHHHYAPDVTDVRASPLLGDLAGLPPAVVLTAGLDPVRDQGRAYAAGLVAAGVPTTFLEAEGNVHAFVLMRKAVPSSQADIEAALTALRSLLP